MQKFRDGQSSQCTVQKYSDCGTTIVLVHIVKYMRSFYSGAPVVFGGDGRDASGTLEELTGTAWELRQLQTSRTGNAMAMGLSCGLNTEKEANMIKTGSMVDVLIQLLYSIVGTLTGN
jgi:hypothetical protein